MYSTVGWADVGELKKDEQRWIAKDYFRQIFSWICADLS
jgi:hypothetical protein